MTTTILSANGSSTQTLNANDNIFITTGVSLLVNGAAAVSSTVGSVQVQNFGTVYSSTTTLALGQLDSLSYSMVYNGSTGIISTGSFVYNTSAIFVQESHYIENHGQITGSMFSGAAIKTNYFGTIVNYGLISGNYGILNNGGQGVFCEIINHGTIRGTSGSIAFQNGLAAVRIVNTNLLDGNVSLSSGGDANSGSTLDSSEGAVRGSITGSNGTDFIASGRNGNEIYGGAGNDTLHGNGGNDNIIGGAGDDLVNGDEGNDLIITFDGEGIDTLDGGAGVDHLIFSRASSTAAFVLSIATPSVMQELADGSSIVNFESMNVTTGSGHDRLSGGALSDQLIGGDGNDTLNGGAGKDNLIGGDGADSYIADRLSDNVAESLVSSAAAERDTVTFIGTAGTYVLGANLENLILGGTAALNGTGNAAANAITGNAAANVLDGMAGLDTLAGMGGADSYFADLAGDVVLETIAGTAGGTDLVTFTGTTGTFTLGNNVEKLTLAGSAAINGAGNTLANTIIGNAGSNIIAGGLGNDTLTGGAGADFFVFNTAPNTVSNKDIITDFNPVADTIRLENTGVFTALGVATGVLNANLFKNTSLAAVDANDRILYNDGTGVISYDIDGTGAAVAIQIAVITGAPTLTNADFIVI